MPETKLLQGDCLEAMKDIDNSSIDAIVTDPPYELGFKGKKWDTTGIVYNVDMWKECLRVLKPGGHLLSFGGSRTYHRMACAVQDAGFEIRDMIEWVYTSGFPKNQNIAKAYNKKMGNKKEKESNPIAKDSSQWEGFGTALKPAHEPIVLARKPLSKKTIVENCIKHGTGALAIDECRIPISDSYEKKHLDDIAKGQENATHGKFFGGKGKSKASSTDTQGRFPANLLVTDDALNDGEIGTGRTNKSTNNSKNSGSKSRYFDIDVWAEKHGIIQCSKANKKERGKDNNHPTCKPIYLMSWIVRLVSKEGDTVLDPFMGSGTTGIACKKLDRNFIGIEKEEEYLEIAQARIK